MGIAIAEGLRVSGREPEASGIVGSLPLRHTGRGLLGLQHLYFEGLIGKQLSPFIHVHGQIMGLGGRYGQGFAWPSHRDSLKRPAPAQQAPR